MSITLDDKINFSTACRLFLLFEPLDTAGIDCRKAISSDMTDYEDAVMAETSVPEELT